MWYIKRESTYIQRYHLIFLLNKINIYTQKAKHPIAKQKNRANKDFSAHTTGSRRPGEFLHSSATRRSRQETVCHFRMGNGRRSTSLFCTSRFTNETIARLFSFFCLSVGIELLVYMCRTFSAPDRGCRPRARSSRT
jgi:hypothetical protein